MRPKWGQVRGREKRKVKDRQVFMLMVLLLEVKE